jgi:hypothetical protein
MNVKIIAALILAVFLAGTHWKAYTSGKAAITKEWELDRAESAKLARFQQDANRDTARKAEIRYVDRETVRTEFLTITEKDLANESANLTVCRLDDGDIGLLNKAASTARED